LSAKEARRVYVMEQVLDGKLTIKLAAELLGLSERQVKRLKKGMKEKGVAALMHGNRGRTPKHTISEDIRDMVATLAQDLYKDASAQHISELLAVRSALPKSNREGPEHIPWVLSPMPAMNRRCPLLVTILNLPRSRSSQLAFSCQTRRKRAQTDHSLVFKDRHSSAPGSTGSGYFHRETSNLEAERRR
jgi:hypothetical protein